MGMRKFGSAAPPFGKVACVVKVFVDVCYRGGGGVWEQGRGGV